MVSKQIEAGAKADVGGMLLAAAVFDIEKACEYTTADNVYTRDGRQKHRGIEFTAAAEILIDGVRWFRSGARPSAPPRRSMAAPWQFCHMMRK